ncbi:MAG: hypothetical protein GY835_28475 [bacterium]|nr:hypothetical protein [bacterium]
MVALNFFNSFFDEAMEGSHTFASDTIKIALINTPAPVATNSVWGDISANEITAENGYTDNGETLAGQTSTQTAGVYSFMANNLVVTASGGTIGPFRYAVMYNDTAGSDEMIGWYDYGSSQTLQDGETLTFSFTTAIFQFQLDS